MSRATTAFLSMVVGLTLMLPVGCSEEGKWVARSRDKSDMPAPESAQGNESEESPGSTPSKPSKPGNPSPGGADEVPGPVDSNSRFAKEVLPTFQRHCSECHHAGAKIDLTGVPSAQMVDRILAATKAGMPPAPRDKMSADAYTAIEKWKADGLP